MKSILVVAGLDPSGGAGILADVKTVRALGFFPSSAVTVVTYQNTCGVYGLRELEPECVAKQISAVLEDLKVAGVKVGLVCSVESASTIAELIDGLEVPKVVDPVMRATVGFEFSGVDVYRRLAEVCDVITPNAEEASLLSGLPVEDVRSAEKAAEIIANDFGCSVIVTGGSLKGKDVVFDSDSNETFLVGGEVSEFEVHGTGCVYSTALTCYLTIGFDLKEACEKARDFVRKAAFESLKVGRCMRVVGV